MPPPPFLSPPPLESMRNEGANTPPQKEYLSDTCRYPLKNKSGKLGFGTSTGRKAFFEFFRPDSGTPPVSMLLQRKKANSLVPAILSPFHSLFRKGGGTGTGIRFSFPWKWVRDPLCDIILKRVLRDLGHYVLLWSPFLPLFCQGGQGKYPQTKGY